LDKPVEQQITEAFSGNDIPTGKLCNEEYDYDDAHHGFIGTTWQEHDAHYLRSHESSLHYFTPEAFRYYLPAFMMAELWDPEAADVIAEGIAFQFTESPLKDVRLATFSQNELLAIIAFLEYCAARYNDGIYDVLFNNAAAEVRKYLNE
jgi:hypothetical protein